MSAHQPSHGFHRHIYDEQSAMLRLADERPHFSRLLRVNLWPR